LPKAESFLPKAESSAESRKFLPKAESHFGDCDVTYFWAFRFLGVLSGVLPQVAASAISRENMDQSQKNPSDVSARSELGFQLAACKDMRAYYKDSL